MDGRIVWIVDAYTTLDNYPYAQRSSLEGLLEDSVDQNTGRLLPRKEVSYIRNSVKATVDAYDGTVTLYQVDEQDPVLNAWMGVFPDAVTAEDQISDELRSHFRYPEDLFKVQREMLAKYHVDEPLEFFTNNAFWSVPADPTVDTTANQPPYYLLMGDEKTADARFRLTSAWWATTVSSCPPTSRWRQTRRTTGSSRFCGCRPIRRPSARNRHRTR